MMLLCSSYGHCRQSSRRCRTMEDRSLRKHRLTSTTLRLRSQMFRPRAQNKRFEVAFQSAVRKYEQALNTNDKNALTSAMEHSSRSAERSTRR